MARLNLLDKTLLDLAWSGQDVTWTDTLIKQAVVWLSLKRHKAILRLSEDDYNNNGLASLLTDKGPAHHINTKIFNALQHTITGSPGRKPGVDNRNQHERTEPARENVLLFSRHPDDDVISMAGPFIHLVDPGHNVHVAYQSSSNSTVWDDDVRRSLGFVQAF